jgi:hypothetical protein
MEGWISADPSLSFSMTISTERASFSPRRRATASSRLLLISAILAQAARSPIVVPGMATNIRNGGALMAKSVRQRANDSVGPLLLLPGLSNDSVGPLR